MQYANISKDTGRREKDHEIKEEIHTAWLIDCGSYENNLEAVSKICQIASVIMVVMTKTSWAKMDTYVLIDCFVVQIFTIWEQFRRCPQIKYQPRHWSS